MLKLLHVENIAVLKRADIEFRGGFTVLTGETGAGKSVIIDGINMICGGKVSRDVIRAGEQYALSEAVFDGIGDGVAARLAELGVECEDGEVSLSHKLNADGKSVVRINGRAVTKSTLREAARLLISIHGQNDSKVLFDKAAYLDMLDSYGSCESERQKYTEIYRELDSYRKKLRDISTDEEQKARERDMLEYQINDIDSKKLKDGEEEALEAEKKRLGSLEKINKHVNFAYRALAGGEKGASASYLLSRTSESLSKISDVIPEATEIAEKLLDMSYEVSDMADRVAAFGDDDGEDIDTRLDKIESRLEAISGLKRRYGRDIKSILEFRDRAVARLDDIVLSDEHAAEYEKKIKELEAEARSAAKALSEKRRTAAVGASQKIMETLAYLDMPKVKLEISLYPTDDFTPSGCDRAEFMVATNPGEPMMPMSEIASGGEMARIMLSLKSVLNEKDGVGCAVYDEIDTGISGKTSRKIGIKLHEIARGCQVICVTHSAQIATLADDHYLISKREVDGRAQTSVRLIEGEERVAEAARILGGINVTEAQRQAARDMIENISE
ncbi:MAG: DNA repair protein RecN [Ruminococcaceae bacterium]|nr:DNA repair protein RecN [Oscillospiraceae bacterium]